MDCNEFVTQRFTAFGPSGLKLLKAYGNGATDEIHRLRGQLENERARAVAELEDIMAWATVDVEAEGMRAAAEVHAEMRAADEIQAQ